MDKRQEDFLIKLREMFRIEAGEHLAALAAGLLAMERGEPGQRESLLENLYRETHTLKGAARSVTLPQVEALCQVLESLFAAMKRGEVEQLSTELLDLLHQTLVVLGTLCENPGAEPTPQLKERYRAALKQLKQLSAPIPAGLAPARSSPEPPAPGPVAAPAAETVRVATHRLNAILHKTEELVGAKLAVAEQAAQLGEIYRDLGSWRRQRARARAHSQDRAQDFLFLESLEKSLGGLARLVSNGSRELASAVDALLTEVKHVLMLPCAYLTAPYPRLTRELARQQGKTVDVVVRGEELEVDRRVLDELKDVLLHLVRNCVDHGIEPPALRQERGKEARGTITIALAPLAGNKLELTVADDGAGIDLERVRQAASKLGLLTAEETDRDGPGPVLQTIFQSGLSTSPIVTELSGRGLGLAIVREKVERLGGTVGVTSSPAAGMTVRMVLPLTLATFRGVMVKVCGQRFVVPSANAVKVLKIEPQDVKSVENRSTILVAGRPVSLVRLRDLLGLTGRDGLSEMAIVVRSGERQVAFLVDEVSGEQEVRVRSLGERLARVRNVQAATVVGNGAVVLILDPFDLIESATTLGEMAPAPLPGDSGAVRPRRILVAEDSITSRTLLKNILESAGFEVVTAVDGLDGLTLLKSSPFDAVVSDVDMPRMNGFELTAKIRGDSELAELPVILVTALASPRDREFGVTVGANAYIVKSSFDQSNLLEILRRYV